MTRKWAQRLVRYGINSITISLLAKLLSCLLSSANNEYISLYLLQITAAPPSSPPKSTRNNTYFMNPLERGSFDDSSITTALPSYLQPPSNMSSTFAGADLASSYTLLRDHSNKRQDSFSKNSPNPYADSSMYENDTTNTNESTLSILPDSLGGNSAKVMVRYPDGSGRTYRAQMQEEKRTGLSDHSTLKLSPPGVALPNSSNITTGAGAGAVDEPPSSNVVAGGGGFFSQLSLLAGSSAPLKQAPPQLYNASVLTSPLISRASRGTRRQLGEDVRDKRAAQGGFTFTSSRGTQELVIPRSPEMKRKRERAVRVQGNMAPSLPLPPPPPASRSSVASFQAPPVVTRTLPIAIPNTGATGSTFNANDEGDDSGSGSGSSVLGIASHGRSTRSGHHVDLADSAADTKPLAASLSAMDSSASLLARPRADSSRSIAIPSTLISASPTRTMSSSLEVELLRDRRKSQQPTAIAPGVKPIPPRKYGINPFRLEEGETFLKMRTHNRRRWAHALPKIQKLNSSSKWKLNWKSLCQPVVLPLTTDYLPSLDEIRTKYTVANYSLVLDSSVCPFSKPESLLAEMVNQRLAQEFQVIDSDQHNFHVYKKLVIGSADKETPDQFFMILSMGHRIHFLCYIPSRGTVNVFRYMSRIGINDSNSTVSHRYRIWSKQFQRFVVMEQNFYQFPEPEHAWNLTDEVLLGNQDILSENSRAKRIRFVVVPCNGVTSEQYQANFDKLLKFLNKYCAEAMALRLLDDHDEANTTKKKNLNVKFWLRRPSTNGSGSGSGSGGADNHDSPQWAYLRCEDTYSMRKVFHLEIYWIVCIASLMDDFVNMLFRRCGSWGLRLIQIPEFFCVANLQMHPFRGNPQIFVPEITALTYRSQSIETMEVEVSGDENNEGTEAAEVAMQEKEISKAIIERDYISPTQLIERLLLNSINCYNKETGEEEANDWIPDDKQRTDWKAMGLPEPTCHLKDNCPNVVMEQFKSGLGDGLLRGMTRTYSSRVGARDDGGSGKTDKGRERGNEKVKSNSNLTDRLKSFATGVGQSLGYSSHIGRTQELADTSGGDRNKNHCCESGAGSVLRRTGQQVITAASCISGDRLSDEGDIHSITSSSDGSTSGGHLSIAIPIADHSSSSSSALRPPLSPPRQRTHSQSLGSSPQTLSGGASTLLSSPSLHLSSQPQSSIMESLLLPSAIGASFSAHHSSGGGGGGGVELSASPPQRSSAAHSHGDISSQVPSLRPRLRRHIHYDNQYMQV
jgi:hypothetical protein